jgi:hypothetical protein
MFKSITTKWSFLALLGPSLSKINYHATLFVFFKYTFLVTPWP